MGTTRELCIGKYSRTDANYGLWWFPTSNSDRTTLSNVTSAVGRKRFVFLHEANSNIIELRSKIDNGEIYTTTKTKTFTASNAVLSAGYYSDPDTKTTAGLPAGTINKLIIYDDIITEAEINAFFA